MSGAFVLNIVHLEYSDALKQNIIWSQYLPQYFNQSYAGGFAYQILIALGTNLIGYGLAGLTRRFLVYPASCVWPASLVTIALNSSFHRDSNPAVEGPFRSMWRMTRLKFFAVTFTAMFIYFWFPNFIFQALSIFSWLSWIAPNNVKLNNIVGFENGLGVNPWPTFDWNILLFDSTDPLMIPFFSTFNKFIGALMAFVAILITYYTNSFYTSFLPINSNRIYDNTGSTYNISRAIDSRGIFDAAKYEAYSPAYLSAGNSMVYLFFFAVYPATLVYIFLYHRYEVKSGFRNLINSFRKNKKENVGQYEDVHNRLMSAYPEVPEWHYAIILLAAIAFSVAGIAGWETYTTPGVVFYGIALAFLFVIPVGIIKSMTGVEVTLNVIAEFIGGSWVAGNAVSDQFFLFMRVRERAFAFGMFMQVV